MGQFCQSVCGWMGDVGVGVDPRIETGWCHLLRTFTQGNSIGIEAFA
jgi:hypothetical protein